MAMAFKKEKQVGGKFENCCSPYVSVTCTNMWSSYIFMLPTFNSPKLPTFNFEYLTPAGGCRKKTMRRLRQLLTSFKFFRLFKMFEILPAPQEVAVKIQEEAEAKEKEEASDRGEYFTNFFVKSVAAATAIQVRLQSLAAPCRLTCSPHQLFRQQRDGSPAAFAAAQLSNN